MILMISRIRIEIGIRIRIIIRITISAGIRTSTFIFLQLTKKVENPSIAHKTNCPHSNGLSDEREKALRAFFMCVYAVIVELF
jgi:hypothetical protein